MERGALMETVPLIALGISFVSLLVSLVAFKISRDNNIINYVRLPLNLMVHLPGLPEPGKTMMKRLVKKNRFFAKEDADIEKYIDGL